MADILSFYNNEVAHPKGFTAEYVWGWDDSVLEKEHTYIQWLFPLSVPSQSILTSPVITPAEVSRFRSDPGLQDKVKRSFQLMMRFYGFEVRVQPSPNGSASVLPGPDFQYKRDTWLRPENHNFKRITRILASLTLLGLAEHAQAFHRALLVVSREYPNIIGRQTLFFWSSALQEPRPSGPG
jgi:hypothetical protein